MSQNMSETELRSAQIHNSFLREMARYNKLFGSFTPENGPSKDVEQALLKRIQRVLDILEDAYEPYRTRPDAEQSFLKDYPHVKDLVMGLAKLEKKEGLYQGADLKKLAATLSPVTIQDTPPTNKRDKRGPNPFKGFKPF